MQESTFSHGLSNMYDFHMLYFHVWLSDTYIFSSLAGV